MPALNRAHSLIDRPNLQQLVEMAGLNLKNLYNNQHFFGILTFQEAKSFLWEAWNNDGQRYQKRILFVKRTRRRRKKLAIFDATLYNGPNNQPRFEFNNNHCLFIREFLSEETVSNTKSDMITRTFTLNLQELVKVEIVTSEITLPYLPRNQNVSKYEMKRFKNLDATFKTVMKCTNPMNCNINH